MLIDQIKNIASEITSDVIKIRRHLHSYPELSFEEHETSSYIKKQLTGLGIPFKSIAGTGVTALIEGSEPASSVIALRADMDALPIVEQNKVAYASQRQGVMHACGHDFHTASLLGTTMILKRLQKSFRGSVKLLFQPGEEVLPGGASIMIKEGALENPAPHAIIGQHVIPRLPAGKIGMRKGKAMASMDSLYLKVRGKGGHGAEPHTLIDPVLIASHIIIGLQQVISRMASPKEPTVLSFGKVIANGAVNVIPDEVFLEGTFRAMNEVWRDKAHGLMKKMAESIAEGMGGTCEFKIARGYPFLVNEEKLTTSVWAHAAEYMGNSNIVEEDIWMAAEDFSYYSQVTDSCFYFCGVGNAEKGITSSLHTPTFDVDEEALGISTGLMAYIALKQLGN